MSDGDYCKELVPPSPTASCYICLDGGVDLLRNCACRGEAGWAHVACLAEFAASQVAEAEINNVVPIEYWTNCNICKTPYMKNMGLAMAQAYVKHYEHLKDTNYIRFSSLFFMASASEEVGDYDGAMRLYTRLQEICKDKNKEGWDIRAQEVKIIHGIGSVFVKQYRFHDALTAFENKNEINVDLYGPNSPEVLETNLMLEMLNNTMRNGHRQKVDTAKLLVLSREQFKNIQEKCGASDHAKLCCRSGLIRALQNDGQNQEALEQYQELVTESTRILGPDHPDTHSYKIQAERHRAEMLQLEEGCTSATSTTASQQVNVWAMIDCEKKPAMDGQRVKVLRATVKDATKYICLHKDHNKEHGYTKFKAAENQLIFEKGTQVIVHGLVSSTDLNGTTGIILSFDKDKHRYAVEVGKKAGVLIKPINLNVVFA